MSTQTAVNKESLKFKWSHQLWIHRTFVRIYYKVAQFVPFNIKYGVGRKSKEGIYPYMLTKEAKNVVQVGAPRDTMSSGRARGVYFSLMLGDSGRVIIVEPAQSSKKYFDKLKGSGRLLNAQFYHSGAWHEKTMLKLYYNPNHPASNFTEGTVEYSDKRLQEYEVEEMPVNTLDNITEELGMSQVDLVSITTNGAEANILRGMKRLMDEKTKYICLARTGENYIEMMSDFGYQILAHDDRGYTFIHNSYI